MTADMVINCPECDAKMKVSMEDIANERTETCVKGHRVTLKDHGGGFSKAQKALDDFEKTVKNFGK